MMTKRSTSTLLIGVVVVLLVAMMALASGAVQGQDDAGADTFLPLVSSGMEIVQTVEVGEVGAAAIDNPITLETGTFTVACPGGRLTSSRPTVNGVRDMTQLILTCRITSTPTATPVPPTATATLAPSTPTATPTTPAMNQIDMFWHESGMAHGDRPAHEHGDAPPQWLLDAGYNPSFTHPAMTPGENLPYWKHTAFKGWAGRFNGQDWYGIFHLDFQPGGHASRFHGYQLWVRDASGDISAIRGWLDFGVGNNTGPNLLPSCGEDSAVRPIMNPTRVGCPIQFESWYARAGGSGGWAPDFGFNINPNFYAGGDPLNPATWTNTGYVRNLERRIEFAWYLGGAGIRPAQRGEFWATQWGDIVSGPAAPVCGTQRTYGERTYTVACIRQYIAPSLQPMTFPGNSTGGTFPGNGVVLPN